MGDRPARWVQTVRNPAGAPAIDDEDCMRVPRLFNEPAGRELLSSAGVPSEVVGKLELLGISSICNVLAAIKAAKYWDLDENDVVFTVFTDSAGMYLSRLEELNVERGAFTVTDAARTHAGSVERLGVGDFRELTYQDRKAIHNLKYYTWVEQQGKTYEEINAQWDPEYWRELFEDEVVHFDRLIEEFNAEVGLG